ncbi:MAG: pantetheine-phosphate adenylyltransferase [Acidimicrobiia bacterium]|nr:pantetheine-phosphate adenylyltransferase [Acidimicrobiia bacterium]
MTLALCPGSFDPVTNGHLDIIERSSTTFDEVLVAVIANPSKEPLFTLDERKDLLEKAVAPFGNVRIDAFEGLLVDFALARGVDVIVKGLRAVSDFDYEMQMAHMNRRLTGIDTFFLPTSHEYSYLAASLVRDVVRLGGDVEGLVPEHVLVAMRERYRR